jgi:hypothetical protein
MQSYVAITGARSGKPAELIPAFRSIGFGLTKFHRLRQQTLLIIANKNRKSQNFSTLILPVFTFSLPQRPGRAATRLFAEIGGIFWEFVLILHIPRPRVARKKSKKKHQQRGSITITRRIDHGQQHRFTFRFTT